MWYCTLQYRIRLIDKVEGQLRLTSVINCPGIVHAAQEIYGVMCSKTQNALYLF